MPITLKDIREHQEIFDIGDISRMDIEEYKQMLSREAYFWMDHHEALRHQLSGEIIAYYPEQIDALIEQLKSYKQIMREAGKGDFD
ncbi:hypothetical protein [Morganella morganii]|uniref:hypothetical protein n=1 Tax=Morganella morganii TaxID=582 RepID=UPI000DCED036|nr:hypothetical protein [Morganella morganii]RAX26894.1 hypothetical protein DQ401_09150 [Morganella morganii]HCT7997074.1 hypothetical protein [Morganella morganii]